MKLGPAVNDHKASELNRPILRHPGADRVIIYSPQRSKHSRIPHKHRSKYPWRLTIEEFENTTIRL